MRWIIFKKSTGEPMGIYSGELNENAIEVNFEVEHAELPDNIDPSNCYNNNGVAAGKIIPVESVEQAYLARDKQKYLKRSLAKDGIIADMAAENMARVRAGIWTVSTLIALTQNPQLKDILDDINTLSFELAIMKLNAVSVDALTTEIKNEWITKLMQNLYN
jgi:hypothetical protein